MVKKRVPVVLAANSRSELKRLVMEEIHCGYAEWGLTNEREWRGFFLKEEYILRSPSWPAVAKHLLLTYVTQSKEYWLPELNTIWELDSICQMMACLSAPHDT